MINSIPQLSLTHSDTIPQLGFGVFQSDAGDVPRGDLRQRVAQIQQASTGWQTRRASSASPGGL